MQDAGFARGSLVAGMNVVSYVTSMYGTAFVVGEVYAPCKLALCITQHLHDGVICS